MITFSQQKEPKSTYIEILPKNAWTDKLQADKQYHLLIIHRKAQKIPEVEDT